MRSVVVLLVVCGSAATGAAQGADPLSDEDREILAVGPISQGEQFGGAALGLVIGFGSGQAVQGRYQHRGTLFTLTDSALLASALVTLDGCVEGDRASAQDGYDPTWCHAFTGTLIALAATHLWQAIDALVVPPAHNRRLRAVRAKANSDLRYLPTPPGWRSYVTPTPDGAGAVAGAQLSF